MKTRVLELGDFDAAAQLYRDLLGPTIEVGKPKAFEAVLSHEGTQIWGAFVDDTLMAMATLHLLPNMTYGARPYAMIENVVTCRAHRGYGFGRHVMEAAIDAAWQADAYKIMLLTGQTANASGFYKALGFSGDEKHALTLRRVPVRPS